MSESVTIILPLPNPALSPNRPVMSVGGRMRKAAATKRYRKLARDAVEELRLNSTPWERATVLAHFHHKTVRRRDDVNHLAMLKAAYDGCVDGGLLLDDDSRHLTTLGAKFSIDREHPRVELTFTRVQ